jgi:hypothetical protein
MNSIFLSLAMITSSPLLAKTTNTNFCDESVAEQVIKFLQKEEPKSELHIMKNEKEEIIGLTDVNEIFPTIDFINTLKIKKNNYENVFQYNTVIIYADYLLFAPNGLPSCKVFNIGTAQDDQD